MIRIEAYHTVESVSLKPSVKTDPGRQSQNRDKCVAFPLYQLTSSGVKLNLSLNHKLIQMVIISSLIPVCIIATNNASPQLYRIMPVFCTRHRSNVYLTIQYGLTYVSSSSSSSLLLLLSRWHAVLARNWSIFELWDFRVTYFCIRDET